jgi:proteic killer suppression protein
VIKSFADKATAAVFSGHEVRRMAKSLQAAARRKLMMLDAASNLDTLRTTPGNRLEALKGDRKGQYSIRINQQWRVCFKWETGHAWNVEIVDYH